MGLNRGNQPVTINLPELLHSSSIFTTNEHPYMRIDIPLLPPQLEAPAPPVDTSSQAIMEEGVASLEGNPVNISPIMACIQQPQC